MVDIWLICGWYMVSNGLLNSHLFTAFVGFEIMVKSLHFVNWKDLLKSVFVKCEIPIIPYLSINLSIYLSMCIYIYIYLSSYLSIYISISIFIYIYIYTFVSHAQSDVLSGEIHIRRLWAVEDGRPSNFRDRSKGMWFLCLYVCIYIYMYIYKCIQMYMYIYIYI